ncbi:response regulator transcription factor, partial [Micromonospora sp. NPDC003776]
GEGPGGAPTVVPVQRGDDPAEAPGGEPEPTPPGGAARGGGRSPRSAIGLTERELQVLLGMAEGKSNAEIGRELFVSEDTVKTHARRLFRKLGARDRAHAVAAGFRAGLVA